MGAELRDHRGTPPGLARVQANIQRTVDAGEIRLSKPRPGATRPRRAGRGSVEANTVKPLSKNPGAVHEGFLEKYGSGHQGATSLGTTARTTTPRPPWVRRVATSTRIVGPTSAAVIKFGTHRLGQEAVHVLFRDGILGGIRFGLNRPEGAILGLGHKVNTSIRPPLTGPLVPQLDLLQLGSINRVGFQEPLADVLPLCAACLRVTIERLEEGGEAGRGHVGLAYRGRTAGSTERGLRLDNVPVAIRSYFRPVSTKSLDRDDPPGRPRDHR